MLSASRCEGDSFAIPKFSLDRDDVEGFMDELQGFHEQFRDCFMRSEPRETSSCTWLANLARWKGNRSNPSLFRWRMERFVRCSVCK